MLLLALNAISLLAVGWFAGTFEATVFLFGFLILNYGAVFLLERRTDPRERRLVYGGSVLLNVCSFLILQHQGWIGILDSQNAERPTTLPFLLGYAFYFLQTLAIHGALYRRVIHRLSFSRYMLAVTYCGAFIAGPLFNANELKIFENLRLSWPNIRRIGSYLHFLIGALLFKFAFADWLSHFVVLQEQVSPFLIARSVFCFELQVYFDFAGYSLLSYFFCRIFGIPMYHNFQQPFAAKNIPEFWRRWHIGLGTFFKENVFTPLRAICPHPWATRLVLPFVVFLLSAAWHGPTWNFLLWGSLHGLTFVLSVALLRRWGETIAGQWSARILLFATLFYGRLLFMDSDFPRLIEKFRRLGMLREMWHEMQTTLVPFVEWDTWLVMIGIASVLSWDLLRPQERLYPYFRPGLAALAILLLALLLLQPMNQAGFVYGR